MKRLAWAYKAAFGALAIMLASSAFAGPREQCYRMHNRITGVPPTDAALTSCVGLVGQGKAYEAALAMVENDFFFSDTLKSLFSPWTNENSEILVPLNDFSATLIGLARDGEDFRQALYGDFLYTCGAVGTPYADINNTHYEECTARNNLKTELTKVDQRTVVTSIAAVPNDTTVPAGIYTTRGFATAFYDAGTNRAATRFTLLNFLCEDIDAFHDTSIADFRVRQDVDRTPGGSTKTYINECKGCHAGMDPLTGAFAFVDYDATAGRLLFTPGQVAAKFYNNAATFPDGYRTPDDSFSNFWTKGQNARVGWGVEEGTIIEGRGPKALGQMYAGTDQYARCMSVHAYKKLCIQSAALDDEVITNLSGHFKNSGYKMKDLFAKTMTECLGD